MRRHGVPDDLIALLGVLAAGLRAYGSHGTITRPLDDGDTLTMGGREFTRPPPPGHSPSDLVFYDAESGLLIGGDHCSHRSPPTRWCRGRSTAAPTARARRR